MLVDVQVKLNVPAGLMREYPGDIVVSVPESERLLRVSDESEPWMSNSAADAGVEGKLESITRKKLSNVKEQLLSLNTYSSTFDPVMRRVAGLEREQERMVSAEDVRVISVLSRVCSASELRRKSVPSLTNHDDPTAVARDGQGL